MSLTPAERVRIAIEETLLWVYGATSFEWSTNVREREVTVAFTSKPPQDWTEAELARYGADLAASVTVLQKKSMSVEGAGLWAHYALLADCIEKAANKRIRDAEEPNASPERVRRQARPPSARRRHR